jgi:cyanophycinase-like exopeptidase
LSVFVRFFKAGKNPYFSQKQQCMKHLLVFLFSVFQVSAFSQAYVSYFTGNKKDKVTQPQGGICLMGGSSESDEAMRWFLQRADGGDVLVLRASGSDGYNDYLFEELGIPVNSVESIVFKGAEAAEDPYIHQKIKQAEAIWLAGGNQWNYVNYWRNTAIGRLINEGIRDRKIVIGGTSAGMAVLGGVYFSAQKGTIRTEEALANPFDSAMTVDHQPFFDLPILENVITDTHYSRRDRQGRHVAFMARAFAEKGRAVKGIACDERTAVCIAPGGKASVYGQSPEVNGHAFFIQTNCQLPQLEPESCEAGKPLTWDREGRALWVYKIKGHPDGRSFFDLNNWQSGSGGSWEYWAVKNGQLKRNLSGPIHCE